ncbi:MAG TPA: aminotransferase class IV [Thermoanaerobaculia bacterium]
MADPSPLAWFNGRLVESEEAGPSVASHTLHYGVGVFDGLMAYWNEDHYHLHFGSAHLERFTLSCERLGLILEWTADQLEEGVRALLAVLPATDYYIRPITFRSGPQLALTGPGDHLPADLAIFALPVPRDVDTSLTCHISPIERMPASAIPVTWKVCAVYANSYLARRTAELAGFDDGLMLDRYGRICEASAANVFFLTEDGIITPALTPEIFPGITRAFLLEAARELGMPVAEREVFPSELKELEGAFLASTLMEMKPLRAIGELAYGSAEHPVFRRLLREFRTATRR